MRTGHIGLSVVDLERAVDFYTSIFGLDVASRSDGYVFLQHGSDLVLTLWRQASQPFARERAGLHHLSFSVDSVAEVEAAAERLRARGVAFHFEGVVPHVEGATSGGIFFYGPDGERLEINAPDGVSGLAPTAGPSCGFF